MTDRQSMGAELTRRFLFPIMRSCFISINPENTIMRDCY